MNTETVHTKNATWRDYLDLCKPRVITLLVITAMVGVVLASPPGELSLFILIVSSIGIGLGSAAGAAINQLVERETDAEMARTENRPLPQGRVDQQHAFVFALLLAASSVFILTAWINVLTAVLTFASMIGYAVIYTMYLKKATPQNIVIGGAAGAAPPVLGWTAITGSLDPQALLLFLIIFTWTPPHFWALAIYRKDEYALVDIPMLPVTHGSAFTRLQILLYTILLVIVTTLPYLTGMSGLVYLAGVTVLNAGFMWYAMRMMRSKDILLPMHTFAFSITYLMVLFIFLLVDHYVMTLML